MTGSKESRRVLAVDVLRGLTILLMVFVNDLGPVAPAWMHHIQPPDADGMTLADVVFPFFLFIAGVSIPLAVEAARERGESNWKIFLHIVLRSLGLLVMGLVSVNRSGLTNMDPRLWGLLCYMAILASWCVIPKSPGLKRNSFLVLKVAGIVGLVALLAVYRREPVETHAIGIGAVTEWTWLQTKWWGILGLIGWAYFAAGTIYLVVGPRREWLTAAAGLLMANYVVAKSGGFFTRMDDKPWLDPIRWLLNGLQSLIEGIDQYVSIGSQLGTLPAIVMCGCVLGTILVRHSDMESPIQRIRWALAYATLLFLAGAMTDTLGGINKIAATPTWCFWCSSLATLSWVGLFWVMDVKGWSKWALPILPTGANPLIAYLLHPIVLFVVGLSGLSSSVRAYASSESALIAILGSIAMAMFVAAVTALIAKLGFRVRV